MTSIIFLNSPKQIQFNFLNWYVSLVHLGGQKIAANSYDVIIHKVCKNDKHDARTG